MPIDSQIRTVVRGSASGPSSSSAALAENETQLLAEIERLQHEVGRLSRKLVEERADRTVQDQVQTVLSSLHCSPTVDPDDSDEDRVGRQLDDGRFMPAAITVGGSVQQPEPGAPRVQSKPAAHESEGDDPTRARPRETCATYEFAPGDDSATAFDEFFNAPDPHLEKIRRFLLD